MNLATWFNNSMDRVTGLYRRKTQFWLYIWATLIVFVLNVDSIVRSQKSCSRIRNSAELLVARATVRVLSIPPMPRVTPNSLSHYSAAELQSQIQDLKLPIGWPGKDAISKITQFLDARGDHAPAGRALRLRTNEPAQSFSVPPFRARRPYPQTPEGWWLKLLGLLIALWRQYRKELRFGLTS